MMAFCRYAAMHLYRLRILPWRGLSLSLQFRDVPALLLGAIRSQVFSAVECGVQPHGYSRPSQPALVSPARAGSRQRVRGVQRACDFTAHLCCCCVILKSATPLQALTAAGYIARDSQCGGAYVVLSHCQLFSHLTWPFPLHVNSHDLGLPTSTPTTTISFAIELRTFLAPIALSNSNTKNALKSVSLYQECEIIVGE